MTDLAKHLFGLNCLKASGPVSTILATSSVAAIVTAVAAYFRSRVDDAQKRAEALRSARLMIYAQLHRVVELSWGHLVYLRKTEKPLYIWLPIFETALPTSESLKAVSLLSAIEAYEITSFFYSYHEQIGYMMGNARPDKELGIGTVDSPFMPPGAKAPATMFGYDFSNSNRRQWLLDSVLVILKRARRARAAVGKQIILAGYRDRTLSEMVEDHLRHDDARGLARPILRTAPTDGEIVATSARTAVSAVVRILRRLVYAGA